MNIIELVKQEEAELIEIRRYLHEHPELSGLEENTVAFIIEKLDEYGIPYINVENGGVLGFIDSGKEGKTVLLRADMDALPIEEDPCNNGGVKKEVVSLTAGVQHACGHDGHTAMLLIAGKVLNTLKDQFVGKVILCFERGEEANFNIRYLLNYMQKEQLKIDSGFGLHISPYTKTGSIMMQEGPVMAGLMPFEITVIGEGGHGSRPDLVNNPMDCFTAMYQGLGQLRLKTTSPFEQLSYSVGSVHSGSKANIIPGELTFSGTVRYYDVENVAIPFREAMLHLFEKTADAYDCQLDYKKPSIFLPLVNHPTCASIAREALEQLFPEDVITGSPWMGSESYAYYGLLFPISYGFLGTNNIEKGITADVHNSKHDLDETVLYKGSCAHISYALTFLNSSVTIPYTPTTKSIQSIFEELGYSL